MNLKVYTTTEEDLKFYVRDLQLNDFEIISIIPFGPYMRQFLITYK